MQHSSSQHQVRYLKVLEAGAAYRVTGGGLVVLLLVAKICSGIWFVAYNTTFNCSSSVETSRQRLFISALDGGVHGDLVRGHRSDHQRGFVSLFEGSLAGSLVLRRTAKILTFAAGGNSTELY